MQKKSSASKIKLNNFDALFGMNETMTEAGDVRYVQISELHSFKNHPFAVRDDRRMQELIASIKENGVLIPGVARIRPEGGYEIIAGHSRKYACEQAGIAVMPMFIRNVSDDDAVVLMVDSNIQREDILPSEKAMAYKMKYDAIKHQGKKGDSLKAMEEASGENGKTIQRYIRLAKLISPLLHRVDVRQIGFIPGVKLAELSNKNQESLESYLQSAGRVKITLRNAENIVLLGKAGSLTGELLDSVLKAENEASVDGKITLESEFLGAFFPKNCTKQEILDVIRNLLTEWKKETEGGDGE